MDKIGKKLFTYSKNEFLYMSDGTFLREKVKTWKYNRPPDNMKIHEIVKVIEENNRHTIEGLIYVAYIDGEFVCYDGNHRLEALKLLKNKKLSLVNVMVVKSDEEIKRRFVELNKSNPVPELYTISSTPSSEKMREIVENVVESICKTYPKFRSSSANPRRPNFNKDTITDLLYKKYKDEDCNRLNASKIFELILKLNLEYSQNKHITHSKFSEGIMKKCKKGGCYLFLKDFTEDL